MIKNLPIQVSFLFIAAELCFPGFTYAQDAVVPYNDPAVIYTQPSTLSLGQGMPTWSLGTDPSGNHFAINNLSSPGAPAYSKAEVFGGAVAITFRGTGIQLNGATGPAFGSFAWSIDGGPTNFADACSGGNTRADTLIDVSGLPDEPHVLKFEITSTACSKGNYQGFYNAVVRDGTPLSLQQGTATGYSSSQWIKSGNWRCGQADDNSDIGGGHCWANNGSLSWNFTGNLVEVYGRPDQEDGLYTVTIDGRNRGTFNAEWGSVDNDALNAYMLFAAKLPDGPHTITIATNNNPDSRIFTQIDLIAAFGGGGAPAGGGNTLAAGTYNLVDRNGNLLDFGFPQVGVYAYNNEPNQQPTYSLSGTICHPGGTNCLSDQGGMLTQGVGADTFSITSVSGGYVIQDQQTGAYLQGGEQPGARMPFSSTQYVWTANPAQPAGGGGGTSLPPGRYNIADQNGNIVDFGFPEPWMSVYSYNNGPHQQTVLGSGNTLCNTVPGGTGSCLSDQNGVLVQGSKADTFTFATAAGGVTIRDNQTGLYLVGSESPNASNPPHMPFSSTNQYVWRMNAVP
jgi:hypothetical protein